MCNLAAIPGQRHTLMPSAPNSLPAPLEEPPPSAPTAFMGVVAAALLALVVVLLPGAEALPAEGQRMAAIFIVVLVLWTTEAVPVGVTSLLAVVLLPIFGVADLATAFSDFMSPVFFFVLAMFIVAQAFISSRLDQRFSLWLLSKAGTDSRRVVLVFMVGTCLISTIMSDVPATAIFMALAMGLFGKMGLTPGRSSFAKALMIGIPFAALIGGVATPAGSSINILGIFFIQEYGNVTIRFLDWMVIGVPMVVILLPLSVQILLRFYPPEMAHVTAVGDVEAERGALGPVTGREWRGAHHYRHHGGAVGPEYLVSGLERRDGQLARGHYDVSAGYAVVHVERGRA